MISTFLTEQEKRKIREQKQCLIKIIAILSSTAISLILYKILTIQI